MSHHHSLNSNNKLYDIFPELNKKQSHFFSEEQFEQMPYFKHLSSYMDPKEISNSIRKSKLHFNLLNIKKGTLICTAGSPSMSGYFLCHGEVQLLIKKNSRQKMESFPRHVLHQTDEKVSFLNEEYGIPINKCEYFLSELFEEKLLFKYVNYKKLHGEGYWGFGDMLKNASFSYTVIALRDCILLEMTKGKFQTCLKDFQLKKENLLLDKILMNAGNTENLKEIRVKMSQYMNNFLIENYDKDQWLLREGEYPLAFYFIFEGEFEMRKKIEIRLPSKLIKDQNKSIVQKQMQVKVARVSENCYVGESEFFLRAKSFQFSAISTQNRTLVLKIQPGSFLKVISEFPSLEKELMVSAKQKYSISNENYLKQKVKFTKTFRKEIENIENKHKEKIINDLVSEGSAGGVNFKSKNSEKNSLTAFEVYSKEGVFFRDTYQKLQGFDTFEKTVTDNSRTPIKKHRIQQPNSLKNKSSKHTLKIQTETISSGQKAVLETYDSKEKLLFSPKKNISILQFVSSTNSPSQTKKQTQSQNISNYEKPMTIKSAQISKQVSPQKKSQIKRSKFDQLNKDQAVFKRVLIKNGRFEQDKSTFKDNCTKPIVHHRFDDVIKECITRKSQIIRAAIDGNSQKANQDIVRDNYEAIVGSLPNRSLSASKFNNSSSFSVNYCKGTEQFKKKLSVRNSKGSLKVSRPPPESGSSNRNNQAKSLVECIGFNEPPKSSQLKSRKSIIVTTPLNTDVQIRKPDSRSKTAMVRNQRQTENISSQPQKFVLLNHMMKPITYSSVQFTADI